MFFKLIQAFKDGFRGVQFGGLRNSHWPAVRKRFLELHPNCEVCNETKKLEVHHKKPVHLFPSEELWEDNLITLCEKNGCHLRFGHLYSYRSFNPSIENDAKVWKDKIYHRPKVVN